MLAEVLRFSKRRPQGLGDFEPGPALVAQGFSAGANLIVPGIGILIGFALRALFSDSNDIAATMQHFNNNVMGPIIQAATNKDFTNENAIGLMTTLPAAPSHIGYAYTGFPQVMPAYYAVAVGNAFARLNPDRLMMFAALIDRMVYDALKTTNERNLARQDNAGASSE